MSKQDPTNQARNRKKATRDSYARLNRAAKEIMSYWKSIAYPELSRRKEIVNRDLNFYEYNLTQDQLNKLNTFIIDVLNDELGTIERDVYRGWYYNEYSEQAYDDGAKQENNFLIVLFPLIAVPISTIGGRLTLTPKMQDSLNYLLQDQYRTFQGLSERTSRQVYKAIIDGMDGGLSKSAILKDINKRFNVAKSNVKRIVDTEVNRTNNNARMDIVTTYRDYGAEVAVMHISALLPTTRRNHAARHGNVYTPEQQKRWWDSGANRINCHCSVKTVRVKDGQVVDKKQQDRVKREGKEFFS